MRLVNGGSSLEGRLEVCLNGVWGTICDQSWDNTDAGVACSQMGYSARGRVRDTMYGTIVVHIYWLLSALAQNNSHLTKWLCVCHISRIQLGILECIACNMDSDRCREVKASENCANKMQEEVKV